MVVMIVLIVAVAGVLKARYSHGRRGPDEISIANDREVRALREDVKQLKDRISVLETIAIEKENSLARQIDQLRDH